MTTVLGKNLFWLLFSMISFAVLVVTLTCALICAPGRAVCSAVFALKATESPINIVPSAIPKLFASARSAITLVWPIFVAACFKPLTVKSVSNAPTCGANKVTMQTMKVKIPVPAARIA
ncbi:Uncharacterised protein [Streptococcus pneumoniae]|nr:Uncharacterised protein [Streptococcus pneumoniae]CRF30206.1 Uncharacterised protein [Streptococcus pneumoniae]